MLVRCEFYCCDAFQKSSAFWLKNKKLIEAMPVHDRTQGYNKTNNNDTFQIENTSHDEYKHYLGELVIFCKLLQREFSH